MNNTLEHGLAVLEFLAQSGEQYAVSELATALKSPASSTCRLLQTLRDAGLIEQDPLTRKYAVGLKLLVLANSCLRRLTIRNRVRPYLDKVASVVRQPVYLTVPDRARAVVVDVVFPGGIAGDPVLTVGAVLPVHSSASGKLCAAMLSGAELQKLLKQVKLERRTEFTITDVGAFRAECVRIRQQGYATAESEQAVGTLAVAAPIFDGAGAFVGSIGSYLSKGQGHTEAWNNCKAEVIAAAEAASYALGFAKPSLVNG